MNDLQRVIKYCAIGFAAFLAFSIISGILAGIFAISGNFSGFGSGKVINESRSFDNIKSLSVDPGIGTLEIMTGDSDKVELVAKNVSENFKVEGNNGKLKIRSKANFNHFFVDAGYNREAKITIYIPAGFKAEDVEINGGAGNIKVDTLSSERLDINAGAGNIDGNNITADKVDLNGGVGEITLNQVNFSDVDMECGVGNIDLQGTLKGQCKLESGVGNVELNLTGTIDDYNLKVEKGLGSVYVDGQKLSDIDWSNKNTNNSLDIDGGVGNINIDFQ
jgi:DUF4097 and DUF4098 domain-containing protein YvlB